VFFFSSRRRHTGSKRDWSSDVCSSDLAWGLWTLQPWARQVAILFAIVSLGTDVVSIVTGGYENAVALLIDLLLIWYLTRPGVRRSEERRVGKERRGRMA